MCKRTSNDPLLRLFLDQYGLNLLALPREGAQVGDLYVDDGHRVSSPGSVTYFVNPPLVLPRPKKNETLADVAGRVSDEIDLKTGLGLLQGFLLAFGASAVFDKVSAAYHSRRARTIQFRFSEVTRDSVDPLQLGARLERHRLASDHPMWAEANRYYLVTAVARTPSISVRAAGDRSNSVDIDVESLKLAAGSAAISVERSQDAEVTYRGSKKLAFGVELLEVAYDPERKALALTVPSDPVRVRGETPEVAPSTRAFLGGDQDDAIVTVEDRRETVGQHPMSDISVSARENELPGDEITVDLFTETGAPSDIKLRVRRGGQIQETYNWAPRVRGKNNVVTTVNRDSKLIQLEDIGPSSASAFEDVGNEPSGSIEAAETPGNRPESAEAAPVGRFLQGRFPSRVRLGDVVSLQVRIAIEAGRDFQAELRPTTIPTGGLDVLLVLHSPGFAPRSETQRVLTVPRGKDSDWTIFQLQASEPGVQDIEVTVFSGGTYLGALSIQTSVDPTASTGPSQDRSGRLSARQLTPGEVALLIHYDSDQNVYRYQWVDGTTGVPEEARSNRLIDTPQQAIEALVSELNTLARGQIPWTASQTREWLQNKGIELWQSFIPTDLQAGFWQRRDKIARLIIMSAGDVVPWELLYPYNDERDAGFLVDQFPISRWQYGDAPLNQLHLSQADFVVPAGSPAAASEEVRRIRELLPASVTAGSTIGRLDELLKLLSDAEFSLLHFACHNAFQAGTSRISQVLMGKQPFQPTFLTNKRGKYRALAPLVFMNACRTDGKAQLYTGLSGWATKFLDAGASAFVGSLWEVVDGAAADFSHTFYASLLRGESLGDSMRLAREAIKDRPGDPTWLAYTLYGDPAATITG